MSNIPILEIPEDINKLCQNYNHIFGKPQFKNFERFITGIIVYDRANIQALAQGFNKGKHYDSLHHFLSEAKWDYEKVMETSISVIKHLDKEYSFSKKGWLVIDDTLIEKYGKYMEASGKLYDHTKGCFLEYAHCLVALLYVDKRGNRYPLRFDLYLKEDYCERTKDRFRTKIEIAKELVQYALDQGVDFQGVTFDSWYFSKELVDFIEENGGDWIACARGDRNIVYQGKTTTMKEFANTISAWDMQKYEKVGDKSYRCFLLKAGLTSLKRGTEKLHILISREYDENNRLKEPVFIVTNRKDFRIERILLTYQMRWAIETFFRDAKQHIGLKDYQVRELKGIKSHWCLVFTSAVVLELIRVYAITKLGFEGRLLTVGELCREAFNRAFRSIIEWVIEVRDQGTSKEAIFEYLGFCQS